MPSTIVRLSETDENNARQTLQNILNDEFGTVTVVLVLGNSAAAQSAHYFIQTALEANPEAFGVTAFAFCPNPAFVKPVLQTLQVHIVHPAHSLDWTQYHNIAVFAISPSRNIIADVLTQSNVTVSVGAVATAVLCAQSVEQLV